jgi:hypothetical protein
MSLEQPVLDVLHADNVEQASELAVQQLEKVGVQKHCLCNVLLSGVEVFGLCVCLACCWL